MTDRELLEAAAKAAGYVFEGYAEEMGWITDDVNVLRWNPLTDDGDALRLAVKLEISIDFDGDGDVRVACCGDEIYLYEPHANDLLAATRRAIVRAAAAIGRGM